MPGEISWRFPQGLGGGGSKDLVPTAPAATARAAHLPLLPCWLEICWAGASEAEGWGTHPSLLDTRKWGRWADLKPKRMNVTFSFPLGRFWSIWLFATTKNSWKSFPSQQLGCCLLKLLDRKWKHFWAKLKIFSWNIAFLWGQCYFPTKIFPSMLLMQGWHNKLWSNNSVWGESLKDVEVQRVRTVQVVSLLFAFHIPHQFQLYFPLACSGNVLIFFPDSLSLVPPSLCTLLSYVFTQDFPIHPGRPLALSPALSCTLGWTILAQWGGCSASSPGLFKQPPTGSCLLLPWEKWSPPSWIS